MKDIEMSVSPKLDLTFKNQILDALEQLIGEAGPSAATLEAVAVKTGHAELALRECFGSNESMIREMYLRRFVPLDEERLRLLGLAGAMFREGHLSVESILRAFMVPWVKLWQTCPSMFTYYAQRMRLPHQPGHPDEGPRAEEVARRFQEALARALPDVPKADLIWRTYFIRGACLEIWATHKTIASQSGGLCTLTDVEEVINHLVSFAAAGLNALRT